MFLYYMNSVIDILKISNIETIGSSADSNIKYVSDIDLQEIIHTDDFYTTILQKFQKKFIEAQNNASTSFTFVVSLNKRQIVDRDRANNYGRPELFDCDFSTRTARFSC